MKGGERFRLVCLGCSSGVQEEGIGGKSIFPDTSHSQYNMSSDSILFGGANKNKPALSCYVYMAGG
jgi:hypothetical protein